MSKKKNLYSGLLHAGIIVVMDVLIFGCILLAFAWFHHGKMVVMSDSQYTEPQIVPVTPVTMPNTTVTPVMTDPVGSEELPPEPDDRTPWQIQFEDHFTPNIVSTANSYSSPNISVTITTQRFSDGEYETTYYVADIYIGSIDCFKTYCANNEFRYSTQQAAMMDRDSGAIIALSGDYMKVQAKKTSYTMRNGEYYSQGYPECDICVLYSDGVMETYKAGSFKRSDIDARGPLQIWNFGPALLDENGKAYTRFDVARGISGRHPRSAVGYFEPGHYCFIAVDGRTEVSDGITLANMAKIFEELGCKQAYNLDGGASSVMTFNDANYNIPIKERPISDMLIIVEPEKGE